MRRVLLLIFLLPVFSSPVETSAQAYNKAISYLRQGNYPEAIFWWRISWIRGERRAEPMIRSLKRRLGIREEAPLSQAHPDLPAVLLLLALLGLFSYSLLALVKKKKPSWKITLFLFLLALVFLLWALKQRAYYLHPPLCVVKENGKIYSAPSRNFPVEDVLAGEELRCTGKGEWLRVEAGWGAAGWIPGDIVIRLK